MEIHCESTGEVCYTYKQYLKSGHWDLKKQELIFSGRPKICKLCHSGGRLSVHHRTYKRIGRETLGDLMYLCQPCHSDIHSIMKRMEANGRLEIKNQYTEEYTAFKSISKIVVKDVMKKEKTKYMKKQHILRKAKEPIG